ncbi:TetR/AcrR family transcriptional regulator [Paenibacillus radicis (ex Gao et al. 2016)]|uniref:TetR family transcriptional regulator n=1 Tax=Paenibacillus radicis (ex Gao et al. 2016) TaxID=1737354 RepID=A0A917M164_9BACL|nr:TetR/AcrR family transcriptional regulator [Paenibacillus radicis (ex Gao et al. 2016)]GGG68642.1 TetR family transcriptional regulator [Paenibacillus radicis (ex Gao et al. 2016)]
MQAAFELFAEYGIEKTSLGMIAKKVGMTKPSIYYHFDSKEQLISRTFDYLFKDHFFATYFTCHSVSKEDFVACMYEGGLKMLPGDDKEHHSTLRVLNEFMMLAEREEQFRAPLLQIQHDFLNGFHELLEKGANFGLVSLDQLDSKAHILALVIDNLSRCKMMKFEMDYPGIWRATVDSVLRKEDI